MLPIAATQPPGEPTRLDRFRGALAGELLVRLRLADADAALADALDRWELSLFQHEPFRAQQLRGALAALLGATWPLRAAVLLEEDGPARAALHAELSGLDDGDAATAAAAGAVRRTLVETLRSGDRSELVAELDSLLLGSAAHDRLARRLSRAAAPTVRTTRGTEPAPARARRTASVDVWTTGDRCCSGFAASRHSSKRCAWGGAARGAAPAADRGRGMGPTGRR